MSPDQHVPDPGVLTRPRVDRLLHTGAQRRVTLVVAGGGFGKTTALRDVGRRDSTSRGRLALRQADRAVEVLAARIATALGTAAPVGLSVRGAATGAEDRRALAENQAGLLCEAVERSGEQRTLVVDDLEQFGDHDSGAELLRALCLQAPPGLNLVLCGRRVPALGLGRLRGRGEVAEISAADLAFTPEETAALLVARLGPAAVEIAAGCRSITAGWAAALQLALDQLERLPPREWAATLAQWERHRGAGWRDFATELVAAEPPATRRILAVAAVTRLVDVGLARGLGVATTDAEVEELQDRGLVVPVGGAGGAAGEGRVVSPVLAQAAAAQLGAEEAAAVRDSAAHWLEAHDRLEEALECSARGPAGGTRALLVRCGFALVGRGYGGRMAEVLDQVGTGGDPALDGVLGAARQAAGDWDGALEVFGRLHRAGAAVLPSEVAWRYGALLYMHGDAAGALEVLSVPRDGDEPLVTAWLSATLWSTGDLERATETAQRAAEQAGRGDDPLATAAAHVAMALVAAGRGDRERNAAEYRLALAAATVAGDSAQVARIHANLSSRAVEEGDYPSAVRHADQALREGAGHRFFAALALCNKAEALLRLGRLNEARATLDRSIEGYEQLGSLRGGTARALLGTLYHQRGDLVRARAAYEHAVHLGEQSQDVHARVTALIGLAAILAIEDPGTARTLAATATAAASSLERPHALCAGAYVELHAGDLAAATVLARSAEAEARRTHDRAALAKSLELIGVAADPPDHRLFQDAVAVWEVVGDPLAQCRTRLTIAMCRDDTDEVSARRAELAARGASPDVGVPALLAARSPVGHRPPPVRITTLGRFQLLLDGQPVGVSAWQSRKARDLLKILIAHHDHAVTRDAAADALWPGDPTDRVANRLSVALSVLRKVLDPGRTRAADHFLAAGHRSIALRTDRVEVDVVAFDRLARDGIALVDDGRPAEAEEALRKAERLYAGDFLEEDLYEDWAVDRRETARGLAQTVSRLLARLAADRGDDEAAGHHLWRLLERDPYDEDAWQAALGTQLRLGRLGQARQLYSGYTRRMGELGVVPLPLAHARLRRA